MRTTVDGIGGERAEARDSEIYVRDLYLNYVIKRGRKKASRSQPALEGVNIDVRKGEFLSLVGPSGCGKSTFLYILAGLIRRSSGDVVIGGKDVVGPALDRGIVMQGYALFPWRTIIRNVEFGLEMKGIPKKRGVSSRKTALRWWDLAAMRGDTPMSCPGA